jgi:chitin disaccharide deacetylase
MKCIVLCADDYGQAPTISKAILLLIKNARVTATSCLVNTPFWEEHAKWLIPYQHQIDMGLHFNLTEGKALSSHYIKRYGENFFPLPVLLCKALLRKLQQETIEKECQAQIDKFIDAMGVMPQFIDGHHHVHQFPLIRDAFIHVYLKRLRQHQSYVRLIRSKINFHHALKEFKKIIIHLTGSNALKQLLEHYQIPHNQSFAGIYSFRKSQEYRQLFKSFLNAITDHGMIMCHPGLLSQEANNLSQVRYAEYQYLASQQFLEDCYSHDIIVSRLTELL